MNFKKTVLFTTVALLSTVALTSCTSNDNTPDNAKNALVEPLKSLNPTEQLSVSSFDSLPKTWEYQGTEQKNNPVSKNGSCEIFTEVVDNSFAGLAQGDTFATHHAFTNYIIDDAKMGNVALGNLTVKGTELGDMDFITYEFSSTRDVITRVDEKTDKSTSKSTEFKNFVAVRGFDTAIKNENVVAGRVSPTVIMVGRCTDSSDFSRDEIASILGSAAINYISKDNNE